MANCRRATFPVGLFFIQKDMGAILIAESGSTKTDWCLLNEAGEVSCTQTGGINPYLQQPADIVAMLQSGLERNYTDKQVDALYFYGAGASRSDIQQELAVTLKEVFNAGGIEVRCDMMGAARSLCANEKGIVSILGTGSNSCYYNGQDIEERQVSLGYIAGDEGSGNYLGKRVLQYYAYKTFDEELSLAFEQLFGSDIKLIMNRLYKEPFPNRYLAGFVRLLKENRGHFMVENIIEDCLNDFFHHHLLKFRQSWYCPLHFTGSVAFEFADIIQSLCTQYEMECGRIVKSPLDGLIKYHQQVSAGA